MQTSHDPTFPLYPSLSFIGFVLSLIPLSWHIEAWNSGTCAFMIWTGISCLIGFINSLIWAGNAENVAPVWCDISSKIILGVSIGIPAATLCITRRLYCITSIQTVSVTRGDKRRMVVEDLCIATGIPFIIMILHYVVQGHRFDILEDIGCYPVVYNTLPAYFLYFMWPVVLGVISFVYSGLTLRTFWIRRAQFNQLVTSKSAMSLSRYLRLMMLAMIDMMCTVPLGIYSIYQGNKGVGLAPWISWEETHFNFSRVALVPSIIWRSNPSFQTSAELTRWLPVFCAFVFFALFGFASEAKKHYSKVFWVFVKPFGLKPSLSSATKSVLPSWVKPLKSRTGPTTVGSLPAYSAKSQRTLIREKPLSSTFTTSFAETEVELDNYTDVEKSLGLSSPSSSTCVSPPAYSHPKPHLDIDEHDPNMDADFPSSPTSLATTVTPELEPKSKLSNVSLRTVTSRDRFYVAEGGRTRTPSPAPFANVAIIPGYHRPFSPPNAYPPALPHAETPVFVDGIHVTIHTVSRSTESLRS